MRSHKIVAKKWTCLIALAALCGCGVKGDPLPPLQPHSMERATERFGTSPEQDKETTGTESPSEGR